MSTGVCLWCAVVGNTVIARTDISTMSDEFRRPGGSALGGLMFRSPDGREAL